MSDPVRFLTSLSNALSTLGLYGEAHPATRRAADASYRELADLQAGRPGLIFTFMQEEVLFGRDLLPELERWEWSARFAQGGIERLEISGAVTRAALRALPRPRGGRARARTATRARTYGRTVPRGSGSAGSASTTPAGEPVRTEPLPVATLGYSLREEREAVSWIHQEVSDGKGIPLLEAYGVVRSLSLAMHGGQAMVMPLLQLKEFDQYTTTHSMNVSVLTMALGEFLGMAPAAVRGFGLAGLLHDLGKVRIPKEILSKPGKLTPAGARRGRGPSRRRRPDDPRGQTSRSISPPSWPTSTTATTTAAAIRTSTTRGTATRPAAWYMSATSTTRSARAGPTATPGPRRRRSTTSHERAGAEFDPAMAAAFIEMMRRWDTRIAIEQLD